MSLAEKLLVQCINRLLKRDFFIITNLNIVVSDLNMRCKGNESKPAKSNPTYTLVFDMLQNPSLQIIMIVYSFKHDCNSLSASTF